MSPGILAATLRKAQAESGVSAILKAGAVAQDVEVAAARSHAGKYRTTPVVISLWRLPPLATNRHGSRTIMGPIVEAVGVDAAMAALKMISRPTHSDVSVGNAPEWKFLLRKN